MSNSGSISRLVPAQASSPDSVRGTLAYNTLRNLIVHGRIAPGTRIGENEVSQRLGMSRTPVRSALQRLRQEGFVVVEGDGKLSRALVAPLTCDDAREVFDILAAVEGVAARIAAGLPDLKRRVIVARMRKLNSELRAISRAKVPDPERRFLNDTEFHSCYIEAAGPRILALHTAVKPQAERYIRGYISRLVGTSVAEHDAIIDALASGEKLHAQRAVEANWHNAAERLALVMDSAGEKGSW
ncbi:MAG: GntR family transcriptional regulator [Gemmatimonadota bacterium]